MFDQLLFKKTQLNVKDCKVCIDPTCEAVFHFIPKKITKCSECGCLLVAINSKTYWSKFSNHHFQYNYQTKQYYRPLEAV